MESIQAFAGGKDPSSTSPLVSIVVPFFNRLNLLPQVIETVARQTFSDWELILVDDCSTQDIAAAFQPFSNDPRIRLARTPQNVGPAGARNVGIDAARGRFIAFLDSDDQWLPEKLARQVAAMEAGGRPAICVTRTKVLMHGGWIRVQPEREPRPDRLFSAYLYCDDGFAQTSSLLVQADMARAVRFVEGLHQYEDHLFFMEMIRAGAKYILIPEALTIWHNDERQDRLSRRDDLERGLAFLARAKDVFSPQAEAAFRIRVLGGDLMRRRPFATIAYACRAVATGAVTPRQVLAVIVRKNLPRPLYDVWRRRAAA